NLFYLAELEFDRRGAAEDRDHDLERLAIFVDLVDHTVEVGERPVSDAHLLVLLELDLEPRLVLRNFRAEEDRAYLFFAERHGLIARTEETRHLRCVLEH